MPRNFLRDVEKLWLRLTPSEQEELIERLNLKVPGVGFECDLDLFLKKAKRLETAAKQFAKINEILFTT